MDKPILFAGNMKRVGNSVDNYFNNLIIIKMIMIIMETLFVFLNGQL